MIVRVKWEMCGTNSENSSSMIIPISMCNSLELHALVENMAKQNRSHFPNAVL